MSSVESLTDLYNAFREAHGAHGRPLSHRSAAELAGDAGKYETFRKIGNGDHGGEIEEETVRALVRMGLEERAVRRAAGHQVNRIQEPFVLPSKADRLTRQQREVVLSVVETILAAAEHRDRVPLRAVAAGQRTPEAQQEARQKARRRRQQMEKET